jgi:subfamily B ATP-binding cassette protein MsbA
VQGLPPVEGRPLHRRVSQLQSIDRGGKFSVGGQRRVMNRVFLAGSKMDDSASGSGRSWRYLNRKSLSFLWQVARPYRYRLLFAVLVSIPLASLGGVLPWALKRVTELFANNASLKTILFWMCVGLAAMMLRSALELVNKYIMTILHVQISNDIRNGLFTSLQKASVGFHAQSRSGELASLVANDAQVAAAGVIELFSALWESPAAAICLLAVMVYFNPLLSLIAVISIPLLAVCVALTGKKAQKAERQFLERQGSILGWMIESLTNVRQVKSFSLEKQGAQRFEKYGEQLIEYRRRAVVMKSLITPAADISNGLVLIIMGIIAYHQLTNGLTTTGDIVGCLAAAFSLKRPIQRIAASAVELQKSVAAIQRITWVERNTSESLGDTKIQAPVRCIRFEDVAFSYDGRSDVIKNVTLTLNRSERIGIVGASGAGKTTLVDILVGFYPCSKGLISIDGIDLLKIDPESWRQQIGIVSQEPFLFDASIQENIRYGNPDADPERIQEAAKLAGCDEIIERLPDGMQTFVGERGGRLSGGERKRVALARALVRPISLLILDEATSELDPGAEEDIFRAVDRLADGLIVLNVSHRRSVLKHCDRVVLLENGSIKEVDIAHALTKPSFGDTRIIRKRTSPVP